MQTPIHPPYEQAVALKKKGGLAKLSSNMISLSLNDSEKTASSPEDAKTASKEIEDVSTVLGPPTQKSESSQEVSNAGDNA